MRGLAVRCSVFIDRTTDWAFHYLPPFAWPLVWLWIAATGIVWIALLVLSIDLFIPRAFRK